MSKNILKGYHPWFHLWDKDLPSTDVFLSKFGGGSVAPSQDGLSFWSYAGYDWDYGLTINC